ncbi:MAG TPA: hypothetical protein VH558_04355 [Pseudolabrys sp.]|jgi:hypothetical protein
MRVSEINLSRPRQAQPDAGQPQDDGEHMATPGRALVAVSPLSVQLGQSTSHAYAPFLAQLVATKDQHPQTRERRRAEPNDALAAYRAAAALKS